MSKAELLEGITKEEYHAEPSLSQSQIKDFLADPQLYYQRYVAKTLDPRKATKAQEFGNAVEELAFTGDLNAVIIPEHVMQRRESADGTVTYAKSGAPYRQWVAEQQAIHGEGVRLLKADEFAKPMGPAAVAAAVDSLRAHEFAGKLLWGETIRHVRLRWIDDLTGLACRCEIDLLNLVGVLGDLKTTREVSPHKFAKQVMQFGYDIQAYFYREGLGELARNRHNLPDTSLSRSLMPLLDRIAGGEPLLCCWVAVKNSPSYHAEVHPVDDDWYSIAEPIVRQAMLRIRECQQTGRWQTPSYGSITSMKPPAFAFNRIDELAPTDDE